MPAILAIIACSKVVEIATAITAVAGAITAIAYATKAIAETTNTIITKDTGDGEEDSGPDDIPSNN